jgi:hypothetical protein
MSPRRGHPETGAALVWAIAVMVLGMLVIVAMSMSSIGQQRDLRARGDKVIAAPIVQAAVTKLRLGLESGIIAEWDRYMPTSADLAAVAGSTPGTVVVPVTLSPAPSASALKSMPAPPNVAVREPSTIPGRYGFWQIFRVDAPKYSWPKEQGNLRYWLRTWTGDAAGGAASEVRYWRIDLRPGRFVDFQMLIDGPIQFADGAVINGPIHTNGFRDELPLSNPPGGSSTRVWANKGSVTCTSNALITSAQGQIQLPNCPKQEATGEYINLLRTEDMFDRVRRGCQLGAPHVTCRFATRDGANLGPFAGMINNTIASEIDLRGYHVHLAGNQIHVGYFDVNPITESVQTTHNWTYYTSADNPRTLYFADSVTVDGTTTGRVTIIARRPVQTTSMAIDGSSNGSANIYVIGNVQHTGQGTSVGLVAQGGLLLSAMKRNGNIPCVNTIEAAMIAVTGTIALDPRYLTVLDQAYNDLKCSNKLKLDGALAAHRSPILYWEWNSGKWFGYPNREYRFDDNLRKAPPPEFPNASPWQAVQVKPANIDCLSGGGAACD